MPRYCICPYCGAHYSKCPIWRQAWCWRRRLPASRSQAAVERGPRGRQQAPPFLAAALGYAAAHRLGLSQTFPWAAAGWVVCAIGLVWVPNPLLALVFGPVALPGVWVAERLLAVVDAPTRRSVILTAAIVGLVLPALTGAPDLYWRTHTP